MDTKTHGLIYSSKSLTIWTYGLLDHDGNGYHTVKIDGRVWTVENLRVTHYNNGDPIPVVTDSVQWRDDHQGAICWYDNNRAKYDSVYGVLYNFYAVMDPRGICPPGWHVPTYDEYSTMSGYLGGSQTNLVSGGKMKEKGFKHWNKPNTGATNSSGWTGLPGGFRGGTRQHPNTFIFGNLGYEGNWWTSSKSPMPNSAYITTLIYNDTYEDIGASIEDNLGASIRLIKNK